MADWPKKLLGFFKRQAVDFTFQQIAVAFGSAVLSFIATYWAAFSEWAPQLNSVQWLAVFFACAFLIVGLVGFSGWAYRSFRTKENKEQKTDAPTSIWPNAGTAKLSAPAVPIFEVVLEVPPVANPSPWLRFRCTAFNGTPESLALTSADGRIRIAQATFHHKIELEKWNGTVDPYSFFKFVLQLPLTTAEHGHLRDLMETDHIDIIFQETGLFVTAELSETQFYTPMSGPVQFSTKQRNLRVSLIEKFLPLQYPD